jgi:hypothetical protein
MNRSKRLISLLVALFVFAIFLTLVWAQDTPSLPGITVADDYANGCIDCHRDAGADGDNRINVALDKMGHVNVSAMINNVPQDCMICHKAGTSTGGLNLQTHSAHYQNPSENRFVTEQNGQCLACHSLNSATGEITLKSGQKNW